MMEVGDSVALDLLDMGLQLRREIGMGDSVERKSH